MQSYRRIVVLMFALLTTMFITAFAATPEELVRMGLNYYKGNGVPEDKAKAFECWKQAAEQGFPNAQYYLANCYQRGEGVPINKKEAVQWFRKAAEQGDVQAIRFLRELGVLR